jgi:predicted DNA-binding transcriptional regulator YafY
MDARESRLGSIIKIIANNPEITMTHLLAELYRQGTGISERTLAKDILALKNDFGLLEKSRRLAKGYVLQDICTLGEDETELVMDAMHVFGARLSNPQAQKMLLRLSALLAPSNRYDKLERRSVRRTIQERNIYGKGKAVQEVESILLAAIRSRVPVALTYQTPRLGHAQKSEGYPLFMVFYERGWYCIVRDLEARTYYPRRLDRIRACKISARPASDSHAEDIKEAQYLLSCGWGMTFPRSLKELQESDTKPEIVVRFAGSVAAYILEATDRHPRGKAKVCRDGTGEVEFRIKLADPGEFQFWVRSFGARAWFVAPGSLVDSERAELRRMAERYAL